MPIRTVALVTKPGKPEAIALAGELVRTLGGRGLTVMVEKHTGGALGLPWHASEEIAHRADLCVVLGGDGTLIHAVKILDGRPVPVLGVNLGSLGFTTEVSREEMSAMLEEVLAGRYRVEERMKLRVHLHRGGVPEQKVLDAEVLNDAVINKGALARIAVLETSADGQYVTTFHADGVIVSTPTGSTAYSLSANGPLVYPTMKAVIVTPICPHSLSQRPLVLPDDTEMNIVLKSESAEMYLTLDGQTGVPMLPGDRVQIKQSQSRVLLIKNPRLDFFGILRTKLGWGER